VVLQTFGFGNNEGVGDVEPNPPSRIAGLPIAEPLLLVVMRMHALITEPFATVCVLHIWGQYTHRVAITNQRIINFDSEKVTFIAKDYCERAIKKPVSLNGLEFLRRFTMHILPHRFVKIRRYGIYNHTVKRNLELQFVPEKKADIDDIIKLRQKPETTIERLTRLTGINPCLCQVCKTGKMISIRALPRIRLPATSLKYDLQKN